MAIEDFIPVSEAKHTVEKQVKAKPSVAELTTVESPGKPVPMSLEKIKTKKKRKRKKTTKTPTSISEPKKDSVLVITEKPQAAQKIAAAIGSPRKYVENNVPYYEVSHNGEKIIVASAVGHLFNLTYAAGQKGWPIFRIEWRPSYEKKSSAFTKRYFNLLKKLSRKAKEIIIATDFDIEGEVIGWNVLRFICKKQNAKRMKYSTLTAAELKKSFENPLEEINWGNAYAGEARHIIDWLYGINLSRALMSALKRTNSFKIMSIGRVQGPALKIIVEREREIENFKSEPYWQILALTNDHEFKHPKDIFEKSELDKFKNIKEANAETKKTEQTLQPPHPFDLTTLQREAYRLHRLAPSQTLRVAQKLYLDGIISYPRTSSQKIPESIEPKKILKRLEKIFPEVKLATRTKPIEGKKSDPAHPSIYPTGDYKKLEEDEEKLYKIIVKRFISCFSPDVKTENTRVVLTAKDNIKFTSSGLKIKEKGWTQIYPTTLEERSVPELSGKVKIDEIKLSEKETQPPKRYTPTSLVTTLEKKNLGTKSTRSMIVDTLFDRGYLDGRSIKATPLGKKLIEALEKYSPIIIDENLTKNLEEEMESIQESKTELEEKEKKTIEKTEKIINDISKDFKAHELEIGKELAKGLEHFREKQREENTLVKCPTCKEGDLRILYSKKTRRYFVACSAYPKCTQTYSLPPNSLIKKSEKTCESCNYPKILAIRKGRRPWEFCFNPECEVNKKLREEWLERQKRLSKDV